MECHKRQAENLNDAAEAKRLRSDERGHDFVTMVSTSLRFGALDLWLITESLQLREGGCAVFEHGAATEVNDPRELRRTLQQACSRDAGSVAVWAQQAREYLQQEPTLYAALQPMIVLQRVMLYAVYDSMPTMWKLRP